MPICRSCAKPFSHERESIDFLERISPVINQNVYPIARPQSCPACRLRRRLAFRNQTYIYTRLSSLSGKRMFSAYPENAPGLICDREEWWSESFDGAAYGREFDFSRSFFEQWQELALTVPHLSRSCLNEENCDYCNNVTGTKDCYLVFNTSNARDCLYCENVVNSRDCIDCTHSPDCELCFDCVACNSCYELQSSYFSANCRNSYYLFHCRSCADCFACCNLYRKEHSVFNRQLTPSEYDAFIAAAGLQSRAAREEWQRQALEFYQLQPRPHIEAAFVENVSGNFIFESKNVAESYLVRTGENLRYCFNTVNGVRDCQDFSSFGNDAELIYESANCGSKAYGLIFCDLCWGGSSNLAYCRFCTSCSDCFGCISLKHKQHSVLNRSYSKSEYESLVPKIIEHMSCTGEWGEFFPMQMSFFPYNQSYAQRLFPLTREEALLQRLSWYERNTLSTAGALAAESLPDRLPPTDEPLTVLSRSSKRPFRITADEIKRYRKFGVPFPDETYDERMQQRAGWIDSYRLFPRRCNKSGKELLSHIDPHSPWVVWDREIYENEFFG